MRDGEASDSYRRGLCRPKCSAHSLWSCRRPGGGHRAGGGLDSRRSSKDGPCEQPLYGMQAPMQGVLICMAILCMHASPPSHNLYRCVCVQLPSGLPVELGATWFHGICGNPLYELAVWEGIIQDVRNDPGGHKHRRHALYLGGSLLLCLLPHFVSPTLHACMQPRRSTTSRGK